MGYFLSPSGLDVSGESQVTGQRSEPIPALR
jgi:hypothetical protein